MELIKSMFHPNSLDSNGLNLVVFKISSTIPHLEFSIHFNPIQFNSLIYDKGYSIRQQMIYCLIQFMKEGGIGYRKISRKLNQWGIKTHK